MSARSRCVVAPVVVAFAALAAAAPAWAHPRSATVAIDYRVTVHSVRGVHAAVLDGDRSLRVRTDGHVTVLGDLNEPMLRIGDGVFVNLSSPTAQADRLVKKPSHGWKKLAGGSSYTWHEHRLSPPPWESGRYGVVARWTVPLVVDGRRDAIGGSFVRVARPRWWLWLAAPLLVVLAGVAWFSRRPREGIAIGAFLVAAAAAVVCQVALLLRDSPTGRLSWIGLGIGIAVAVAAGALVVLARGITRVYTAGGLGAGIAAWTLSWFGVFFHGAVIAALPGSVVRACCAVAAAGGLVAVAGSLTVHE